MNRKSILKIKKQLEYRTSESVCLNNEDYILNVKMTISLYQINSILFSSINERLIMDIKGVTDNALKLLENNKLKDYA